MPVETKVDFYLCDEFFDIDLQIRLEESIIQIEVGVSIGQSLQGVIAES